jgi:hypothetical protein
MFRFLRSKEAGKMQWEQNPNQSNADNLNNVKDVKLEDISETKQRNI